MKSKWLVAMSLFALPGISNALPTNVPLGVLIDGCPSGTWEALSRPRQSFLRGAPSCRYRIAWSQGLAGPGLTRRCFIEEVQSAFNVDCDENSCDFFPTVVGVEDVHDCDDCGDHVTPQCFGFDPYLQSVYVEELVAGEHLDGLSGVICISSYDDLLDLEVGPIA